LTSVQEVEENARTARTEISNRRFVGIRQASATSF
jgi:hypothetical protein